jgi:hypothetical protein
MLRSYISVVMVLSFCTVIAAAEMENPYKRAKAGDWVEYKTSSNAGGMAMTQEMRQTVLKRPRMKLRLKWP